ncbi:MAG: TatD family hydrolase [Bacteroidota bacterium]
MPFIDTHIHLYAKAFEADRAAAVERARAAGVGPMVLPAIDVASIEQALALCEMYPDLYAMAALHPSATKEATEADFQAVAEAMADPRVVAVGESGLDYYWDRSFDEAQHRAFRWHIRLALDTNRPLILHSRDKKGREEVYEDLVRLLEEEQAQHPHGERLRGIFHCFGGPGWLAEAAQRLGFLLGLGGTLTFKNSGVAELVATVPLDRFVLETDAPYLAPVPYRGKRNEPAYVPLVAARLAEVHGVSVEEVERVTSQNARALFDLPA